MPRYYFNVFDGADLMDDTGVDLPDVSTARWEAIRLAGKLIEAAGSKARLGAEWRMEVTDSAGLMMFQLDFMVTDSPAVERITGAAHHSSLRDRSST